MSPSQLLDTASPLGYFVTPSADDIRHGYAGPRQLHVVLRKEETDKHFDPTLVLAPLVDKNEGVRIAELGLTPPMEQTMRAALGPIVLQDRARNTVHFFTFGGDLTVRYAPGITEYTVNSPAPILMLEKDQHHLDNQFADEVEATVARIRARWGLDDVAFWQRLASLDPIQAYVGSLKECHTRYHDAPILGRQFPRLSAFIAHELSHLSATGLWTDDSPCLIQLLSPDQA